MQRVGLILVCALLASPLWADACARSFEAGRAAFQAQDRGLHALRGEAYGPAAWVSGPQVLARLEARSELTDQCQELAALRLRLDALRALLADAERHFALAVALCHSTNRERAQDNLALVREAAVAFADEVGFLTAVAAACRPP